MNTRSERLAAFSQAEPPPNEPLQILCEDGSGTYLIPYPCKWVRGIWVGARNENAITANVVGWRRQS